MICIDILNKILQIQAADGNKCSHFLILGVQSARLELILHNTYTILSLIN